MYNYIAIFVYNHYIISVYNELYIKDVNKLYTQAHLKIKTKTKCIEKHTHTENIGNNIKIELFTTHIRTEYMVIKKNENNERLLVTKNKAIGNFV
jgi:hypothetical protein